MIPGLRLMSSLLCIIGRAGVSYLPICGNAPRRVILMSRNVKFHTYYASRELAHMQNVNFQVVKSLELETLRGHSGLNN